MRVNPIDLFSPDPDRPVAGAPVEPYKWLIIDGGGLAVTSWATHRDLDYAEDRVRAAIYVFVVCLSSLSRLTHDQCRVVVCWDGRDNRRWRRGYHPWYKHGRGSVIDRVEVRVVIDELEGLLSAMGVATVKMDGCEADDVVATIARDVADANETCLIFSNDKDYLQLIDDHIHLMRRSLQGVILTPGQCELLGVDYGERYLHIKALSGDSGDNIRGLRGIGVKKAQQALDVIPDLLETCKEEPNLVDWESMPRNLYRAFVRAGRQLVSPLPVKKSAKFIEKFCERHGIMMPATRDVPDLTSLRHAGLEAVWSLRMVEMDDRMEHPPLKFPRVDIEKIPFLLRKLDLHDETDLLSSIYALARMRNPDAVPPRAPASRAGSAVAELDERDAPPAEMF